MGQEWYYQQNGQKHGPVSGASLKQLAAAGKLQPTDLIWKEGMAKWVPARSVKGLLPAAQAPVATAAPPPPPVKAAPPVADGVSDVVEVIPAQVKAPLQERAMALVAKAKRLWLGLGTPAKAGVVGGAAGGAFLLLLLFCVLPLWWFFGSGGGSGAGTEQVAAGGQKTGQNVGGGSYADKAMKTPMAKRFKGKLKDVRPGSRDDFIQALAVLGTTLKSSGKTEYVGDDGRRHSQISYSPGGSEPIPRETYEAVFGKPKRIEPHSSGVRGGSVWYFWVHQCSDGEVILSGIHPDMPDENHDTLLVVVSGMATPLD